MIKKLIPILLILLLLPTVFSIGVSPIRKVVDYEPNKEIDLALKIKNTGNEDIKAIVYARGPLAEHIGIIDSLVTVTKGEGEKYAKYKLKLPSSMPRPGVHKADLVVMEYPSSFGTEQQTIVSATASVVSELWVRVPFPGKYAEAQLFIDSKGVNEDVDFAINIFNFGKEDIQKARARIKILGATYEEIAVIETNEIPIASNDQKKLYASWLANVNPGRYHVVADIFYDDKKLVIEQNFEVGSLNIAIKQINVQDFSLGQVAILDIILESQWNEPINNVYGEITVIDSENSQLSQFKTASIEMPAMGEGLLKGYWDTRDIKVGIYNLRLLIHYAEKVTEKLIETEVNIDSIRTELGPTAQIVAGEGLNRNTILTVLVIILVIINIAWFIFFIKKKK